MSAPQPATPQKICESILNEEKQYNIEHKILPSENAVVDRLLSRGLELKEAYEELHEKLHKHPPALKVFLGLLLSTAAFWSPEKITKARSERDDLANINQQIATKAAEQRNCWSVVRTCTILQVSAVARTITSAM